MSITLRQVMENLTPDKKSVLLASFAETVLMRELNKLIAEYSNKWEVRRSRCFFKGGYFFFLLFVLCIIIPTILVASTTNSPHERIHKAATGLSLAGIIFLIFSCATLIRARRIEESPQLAKYRSEGKTRIFTQINLFLGGEFEEPEQFATAIKHLTDLERKKTRLRKYIRSLKGEVVKKPGEATPLLPVVVVPINALPVTDASMGALLDYLSGAGIQLDQEYDSKVAAQQQLNFQRQGASLSDSAKAACAWLADAEVLRAEEVIGEELRY